MDVLTDRTPEIERRLRAILIDGQDGCAFFQARDGNLVNLRQCWYCRWAAFDKENLDIHQRGLCKFKR